MDISYRKKGEVQILDLSGNVSFDSGPQLREEFKKLTAARQRLFILNTAAVPYMDSAAVAAIVACHKRAAEQDGVLKVVVAPDGRIHELLILTGLDRVLDIHTDEEAAIVSFIP